MPFAKTNIAQSIFVATRALSVGRLFLSRHYKSVRRATAQTTVTLLSRKGTSVVDDKPCQSVIDPSTFVLSERRSRKCTAPFLSRTKKYSRFVSNRVSWPGRFLKHTFKIGKKLMPVVYPSRSRFAQSRYKRTQRGKHRFAANPYKIHKTYAMHIELPSTFPRKHNITSTSAKPFRSKKSTLHKMQPSRTNTLNCQATFLQIHFQHQRKTHACNRSLALRPVIELFVVEQSRNVAYIENNDSTDAATSSF